LLAQVHLRQRLAHGFRPHLGDERLRAIRLDRLVVFVFAQKLVLLERRRTRVNDHVVFIVNHPLEVAGGHIEHQANPGRHALEEPDMADRHRQLDMPHAFAAHARERYLHPAAITNHAAVFDALELAARAFPIFDRAENALAKQAAFFRLEGAIIDGFGILDFPFGPGPDGVRRGYANRHVFNLVDLFQTEQFPGAFFGANHTFEMAVMTWGGNT